MKNFTNNFKQFTSRLSARWLIMALMLLLGTSSAWGWGYKSAGGSWNDCTSSFASTSFYTTPTSSTASSYDILMKTKPGSGFNICQNACSGQQLYVGLTGTASSSSSTIVRAVAKWNNGLYCTYTVVIPDGNIYIKPTNGTAVTMTKSSYTYTAELTLSDEKTFDLYASDPGATITNQSSMPAAGKPSSVRLNYTGLESPYKYVKVTYDLKTNKITFEDTTPPCTPSATITEATYACYENTIHLEGNLTEACGGMYFGWQYKTTSGDDWSTATAIPGHASNNYATSAKTYELDWTIPSQGTTYYFRAYATPDAKTWYSDGTTETVKTYKSPTLYTVSGSDAELTLSDSESGCTYTLYNNGNLVSNSATEGTGNALSWTLNDAGTYTVKAKPAESSCDEVLMNDSYNYSPCTSLTEPTVSIISASYDMNAGKFTVSGRLDHAGCSNNIYVGYIYKLSNGDAWSDLIEIDQLTKAGEFTKEGISIAGAAVGQKYIFQTYAINGYPNYQESSAVLSSSTIEVEVQDGYTVYVRRPKSGDDTNVYTNWYELSSVKGGAPYVKSGAISGNKDNNQATTNNTGGTEMTYAFTDCDGFVWDSFKPAKNQTQFYIHALNDIQQNGWATFSKTATITAGKDNYFYLSEWSTNENLKYGVTITSTSQPTRGVRIKALGSTEVISNNMASFAAISFAGNCTGKDFPRDAEKVPTNCFQWKYSKTGTTWSNYTGTGATWNNIRPTEAGFYKLVCTMEDKTTAESNSIEIKTKSKSYTATDLVNITSALPIIMVNTGDNNGFPACSEAGDDYPSKHADAFKKKLSVDVKIKVGNEIVYDKKARMNYRGSSSLNFKKKSYAFCPGADMCGLDEDKSSDFVKTKKLDMLSLITGGAKKSAKDKDWVLYAATPDPSMMRNILAMETFSAMTGKWGVKNQYVELYVDGEYQGVYVFMDKITQNDDRVNVKWKVDGSKKGFIVKFDKTDYADRYELANGDQKTFESALGTGNTGVISYGTEIDQRFEIEYPEKDKVLEEGGSWAEVYSFVKGKIDAFEAALKDGDFNTVRSIIDYKSWADFFILTEFAKNGDGYRASCVFVYEGGLLKAYPLWDYELSFNNETRQEHEIEKTTGLLVNSTTYNKVAGENGTFPAPFWWTGNYYNKKQYKGLLDDPCFISMVNARWAEHTNNGGALSKANLEALVKKYNDALIATDATTTYNTPQKREAYKWPYDGTTRGKTCNNKTIGYYGQGAGSAISKVVGYDKQNNVEGSLDQLNAWIGDSGRRTGLAAEIEALAGDVTFAISVVADKTTTTPWRPVTITVNANSGYQYTITPTPAKLEENGHIYTVYLARPEGTEGTNFTKKTDAYIFKATTGATDQCGTSEGSTIGAEVKISLEDVVENCN